MLGYQQLIFNFDPIQNKKLDEVANYKNIIFPNK